MSHPVFKGHSKIECLLTNTVFSSNAFIYLANGLIKVFLWHLFYRAPLDCWATILLQVYEIGNEDENYVELWVNLSWQGDSYTHQSYGSSLAQRVSWRGFIQHPLTTSRSPPRVKNPTKFGPFLLVLLFCFFNYILNLFGKYFFKRCNVICCTCSSSVSIPFILLIDVKYSSGGQVRSVRSLTMPDFLDIFWIN